MKYLLIALLAVGLSASAQDTITNSLPKTGFIYANGIYWQTDKSGDSIKQIFIEGDTMAAIRNLLIYCLQEKAVSDNAQGLLRHINLDVIKGLAKSKDFDYYLKEYRKAIADNKRIRKTMQP